MHVQRQLTIERGPPWRAHAIRTNWAITDAAISSPTLGLPRRRKSECYRALAAYWHTFAKLSIGTGLHKAFHHNGIRRTFLVSPSIPGTCRDGLGHFCDRIFGQRIAHGQHSLDPPHSTEHCSHLPVLHAVEFPPCLVKSLRRLRHHLCLLGLLFADTLLRHFTWAVYRPHALPFFGGLKLPTLRCGVFRAFLRIYEGRNTSGHH